VLPRRCRCSGVDAPHANVNRQRLTASDAVRRMSRTRGIWIFLSSMSYYGAASATDTYTYTSGGGSCTTPEYFEEAFTAERYYPDISTLGSGNVCYRETTPACAWGFFHGVGYGIADTDDCRYHNCITCSSNVGVTTFYGDVNNVTNRYLYSGSAINPEAKSVSPVGSTGNVRHGRWLVRWGIRMPAVSDMYGRLWGRVGFALWVCGNFAIYATDFRACF